MSYCTADDILKWIESSELVQLTDDGDLGVVNDTVVGNAIEYASAVIDGYLGARYTLPLATVPVILKTYCTDIAICALYDRRPAGRPEHWQDRCKNADRFLGLVAAGKISLGAADPAGTGESDTAVVDAADPIFSREELERY